MSFTNTATWAENACQDLRLTQRSHPQSPSTPNDLTSADSLQVHAQQVDLKAHGVSHLSGDVRMLRDQDVLLAEKVEYDRPQRRLTVDSKTLFETNTLQVSAASSEIDLNNNQASFRGAEFISFGAGARGEASEIRLSADEQAILKDVRYSSCPPGREDWLLSGDEIKLDHARGLGSARNVSLRFKGVPLFWAPLFYFPVGEQRQSGFLAPEIGDSDTTGADVKIPFYINLAANYDLTLIPRYMAERGGQLGAEFRYLWTHGDGITELEYLPRDERDNERRYRYSVTYDGGQGQSWTWGGHLQGVSDNSYFADLGGTQSSAAQSQLPEFLFLHYRGPQGLRAQLAVRDYQSLDASLTPTQEAYARLPELDLHWQRPWRNGSLRPVVDMGLVNFQRDGRIEGWRGHARVGVDWAYDSGALFANSHAGYSWTGYDLRDSSDQPLNLNRELPSFQLGMGLRFLRLGSNGRRQTLTPQINYLYVPYRDQNAIPIFDTSLPDFSFDQLFALNRFTGLDRIADANLLTLAVRNDWFGRGGTDRQLSAKLGVQWRFKDAFVGLNGDNQIATGSSDWLGEFDWRIHRNWHASAGGQWDGDENRMNQGSAAIRYAPGRDRYVQMAYRFTRDNFEQADALAVWPITQRWRAAARWTYELDAKRSLETLAGVEYRSCCWGVQVGWRRYLNGDAQQFNSSAYIQLELNGLARIGEGLVRLLDRDILAP